MLWLVTDAVLTFHQGTLKKHRSIASGPTKLVTDYTVDLARRRSWVDSNLSTLAMSSIFVIDFWAPFTHVPIHLLTILSVTGEIWRYLVREFRVRMWFTFVRESLE